MTHKELERAELIALTMESTHMMTWSFMWPFGHCGVTSLALAPVLRMALELDLRVVVGVVPNTSPTPAMRPHAWIESPDGDIIDPTYSQFCSRSFDDPKLPALRIWKAHEAAPHCPEIALTLDQEEYFRRSVKPRSSEKGWTGWSSVRDLFSNYPRITKKVQHAIRTLPVE